RQAVNGGESTNEFGGHGGPRAYGGYTAQTAEALAREFWADSGLADVFPRPIERAASMRLPLTVVKIPAVAVDPVRRWLGRVGLAADLPDDRRDLMGCL